MSLGKDGMQPHMGDRYRPGDLHTKLTKGKAKWQSVFTAIIKPECGGLCVLECKRCKKDVSPVNPADSQKRHKCTPEALAAAGVRSSPRKQPREQEEEFDELGMPVHPAKKPTALQRFTVSAAQYKEFHRLFAIHLIVSETPFLKVECPALR